MWEIKFVTRILNTDCLKILIVEIKIVTQKSKQVTETHWCH